MARGSRHKSTRHSSRDARESSDSEYESSLRDRKGKENGGTGRVLKESASSEKRRVDSKDAKDFYGSEIIEKEDRGSSKRRKERYDEGTTDRWNGGSDDDRADRFKRSKASADSKSKRKDESFRLQCDGEELKKSSGKSEGRHRESSRKEGRNGGVERERKGREGRSDNTSDEHRIQKQVENNTENFLQSPKLDDRLEARLRKRAGSFDGDRHKDDVGYTESRKSSSKNDAVKDGRRRSDKHKDERNKEKYWEDVVKDRKQRDKQVVNNHRSNEKKTRDEEAIDKKHKRDMLQDSDPNQQLTARACEGSLDAKCEKDRDHDLYHVYNRDHDQESRHGHDRDRDHDPDGSQNRSHRHVRDRHNDYECDADREELHLEDGCTKYIDNKGRKRSPNDHDDSIDTRSKGSKNSHHSNERKRSLSDDKVELVADRRKSRSRSRHVDGSLSSHRRKSSPSPKPRACVDEYRHPDQKELRDRYAKREETSKSITARDQSNFSGGQEKRSKYAYVEKSNEADGGNAADLLRERSLNSKNIDAVESGRRRSASIDTKDLSNKDRQSWDLPSEKPPVDESSQAESSFFSKASQSNPSSFRPDPAYKAGVDISFDGPVDDDSRFTPNNRFRRSGDPNFGGRMHVNAWRGVPNWTTPLPNGFIPFQHGPPHGGFPSIMPQFPAPPLFGIRSPLEINHSGIPYRMPDAERFSSHLHPLGWQNMLDGSSPSHLHGWDGNNGIFRDESHFYNSAEWEENKQMANGRGWESRADLWKKQSGFPKKELPSQHQKDVQVVQDPLDDVSSREVCDETSACILEKTAEMKPNIPSSAKESPKAPELLSETPTPLRPSMDNNSKLSCFYLFKLEISAELTSPDLYHQCKRLMDIEHCETANKENVICIIPESGPRAVVASLNSTHQSLFHSTKTPVFQRAMDLYKKQRTERKELQQLVSGAKWEVGPGEQGSTLNDEEVMVPVSTSGVEDVADVPTLTVDDKEVQTTDTSEILEDSVSNTSQEEERHLQNSEEPSPVLNSKEEKLDDSVSHASREEKHLENSEEPSPDLNSTEVVVVMAPEQQMNSVEEKDTTGSMEGIANGDDSTTRSGIENRGFDKAVSNPSLSFTDEVVVPSEGGCEGLMPGSIESESLISSRIHHSSESTH